MGSAPSRCPCCGVPRACKTPWCVGSPVCTAPVHRVPKGFRETPLCCTAPRWHAQPQGMRDPKAHRDPVVHSAPTRLSPQLPGHRPSCACPPFSGGGAEGASFKLGQRKGPFFPIIIAELRIRQAVLVGRQLRQQSPCAAAQWAPGWGTPSPSLCLGHRGAHIPSGLWSGAV